ncbi:MAG: glutamine synthetase III family protein [Candidatus Heimdallarchaeaceae archaeon]
MLVPESFGENTFSLDVMEKKLPRSAYEKLIKTLERGEPLDPQIAEAIATAMKEWAIERGATHYTHWFQPLSRGTAEKHHAFFTPISINGRLKTIKHFDETRLVQDEPDASSFPSGGMRTAFEARGYTLWDPTSPAFLIKHRHSSTLCIPSVFFSFNGDTLDKKTPLLRSIKALNKVTKNLLSLLDIETEKVYSSLGPEQEFFLVDKKYFDLRPDLRLTGRTLIGYPSPRGQKLEDHYLGTIHEKILDFMQDLENEAFKLGIAIITRHNEVAPSQFELATMHEHSNIANDQNRILMEIMPKIARKHGLECLLHEKPFDNINGSGKHNNWSIMTKEGKNLFEPGETFDDQIVFLLFITVVIYAIYKHSKLLRASVACPGNDLRLGGYEAPPSIISVFLGDYITQALENIASSNYADLATSDNISLDLGLEQLPLVVKDNTDRNRTSPFAFTGNKFEFRAVGSSQSLGYPNAYLNTVVTESIETIAKSLEEKLKQGADKNQAILDVIQHYYSIAKPIVFNGNNYDEEWVEEAKKRVLYIASNSFEALQTLTEEETIQLLEKYNILSHRELMARYSIDMRHLRRIIEIEASTLLYMIESSVIPATLRYLKQIELSNDSILLQDNSITFQEVIKKIKKLLVSLYLHSKELKRILDEMIHLSDDTKAAGEGTYKIRPLMEKIRTASDALESMIPKDLWPFPSYIDLLHSS